MFALSQLTCLHATMWCMTMVNLVFESWPFLYMLKFHVNLFQCFHKISLNYHRGVVGYVSIRKRVWDTLPKGIVLLGEFTKECQLQSTQVCLAFNLAWSVIGFYI